MFLLNLIEFNGIELNTFLPILVTLSGMFIEVIDVSRRELSLILVKVEVGVNVINLRFVQPLNND